MTKQGNNPNTAAGELPVDESTTYLAFALAGEYYAVPVLHVREIVGNLPVVALAEPVGNVVGMIPRFGRSVPVVDLRRKLSLPGGELAAENSIIVVDVHGSVTGLLVDRVVDVLRVTRGDVLPAPKSAEPVAPGVVAGRFETWGLTTTLLELARVLSAEDVEAARRAARAHDETH